MLPTGHNVLHVGVPNKKKIIACKIAYTSADRDRNQKGSGYQWKSWKREWEREK